MITSTSIFHLITQPKYLFVGGLVIIIIAIVMLKTFTPLTTQDKSSLTKQNFDQSTSTFQLNYAGVTPTFPQDLPLGQLVLTPVSQAELLAPIVKAYQLQPEPGDPLVWTSPDYVLVKDEGSAMFTLASQQPAQRSDRLDEAAAISQAEKLVKTLFPLTPLSVLSSETKYLAGDQEQKVVSSQQAELIDLVFAPMLSNLPVLLKNSSQSLVQIELDSQAQLVKLNFFSEVAGVSIIPGQGESYPLLSIDQAIKNIYRSDGAIITADSDQVAKLDLNTKLAGDLKTVALEYRSNDDNQLLPYYRFSGLLQADAISLRADIITPAIDQKTIPSP